MNMDIKKRNINKSQNLNNLKFVLYLCLYTVSNCLSDLVALMWYALYWREKLLAIKDKLKQYVRTTKNETRLDFIVEKLKDHMDVLCAECERDRITCALRPLCPEREYLNILISAGVDEKSLPQQFCFKLQKQEVSKFLKGKSVLRKMRDVMLPLSSFIEICFGPRNVSKVLSLVTESGGHTEILKTFDKCFGQFYDTYKGKFATDTLLIYVTDVYRKIFYIDLDKKLVTINLERTPIITKEETLTLASLFCEQGNIDCKLFESAEEILYFKVTLNIPSELVDKKEIKKEITELENNLSMLTPFINIKLTKDNQLIILGEIYNGSIFEYYLALELRNIFGAIIDLHRAIQIKQQPLITKKETHKK